MWVENWFMRYTNILNLTFCLRQSPVERKKFYSFLLQPTPFAMLYQEVPFPLQELSFMSLPRENGNKPSRTTSSGSHSLLCYGDQRLKKKVLSDMRTVQNPSP